MSSPTTLWAFCLCGKQATFSLHTVSVVAAPRAQVGAKKALSQGEPPPRRRGLSNISDGDDGRCKRPPASLLFDNPADENEREVCHSRSLLPYMTASGAGTRKGKPTGDGTCVLHSARPQALEGSTPSPSASLTRNVPGARRDGGCLPNSPGRVRLPPGTLTDATFDFW